MWNLYREFPHECYVKLANTTVLVVYSSVVIGFYILLWKHCANLHIQPLIFVLHWRLNTKTWSYTYTLLFTFLSSFLTTTANHIFTLASHLRRQNTFSESSLTTLSCTLILSFISPFAFRTYILEPYPYSSVSLSHLNLTSILYTSLRNVTHHITICHYATTLRIQSPYLNLCVYSLTWNPYPTLCILSPLLSSYLVTEMCHCIWAFLFQDTTPTLHM